MTSIHRTSRLHFSSILLSLCALLLPFAQPVNALDSALTASSTAPSSSLISQPLFNGSIDGGKDYSDNNGTPGQTFTTGSGSLSVTALTVKGAGSYGGFDIARYFVLSISTATGTNSGSLSQVRQEVSQAYIPANGTDYLTFTLSSALTLNANTIYEYDIYTTDNPNPAVRSGNGGYYAFAKSATDSLPNGSAIQNGFEGANSRFSANPGTVNTAQLGDRTFFLQGTAIVSSLTWDANNATGAAIENGSGTWINGGSNFNNGSGNVPWNNASPVAAVFGGNGTTGSAGIVTLGGPISAGGLTFGATSSGNYTITGDTLTLVGTPSLAVSQDATINSAVAGTVPITKSGSGTITLGGANTFSGQMNVIAGTAKLTNVSALGTTAGSTVVTGGAAVDIATAGTIAENFSINGTGIASAGALVASTTADSTVSGTIALQSDSSIGVTQAAGHLTATGVISGGFGLTKVGAGKLTVTAAEAYTGATVISAGTLEVGDGTTDGSLSSSSNVVNNSVLSFNVAGSQTLASVISGTGSVTKIGGGTQTLSAANTYQGGTTITSGTLAVGSNTALGAGIVNLNGGTLKLTGASNATAIGIKLGVTGNNAPALTASTFYGVVPILGSNYNSFSTNSGGPSILKDSNGATTAATLTSFSGAYVYGTGSSNAFLNGYLDTSGSTTTANVSVSGLTFDSYSVYAYFNSDASGRTGSVNIGSTTYYYQTLGNTTDFIQTTSTNSSNSVSADYAILSGLTSSSFSLDAIRGSNNSGLNGVEIVGTTTGPVTLANAVSIASNSIIDVTGRSSASITGALTIGANTLSVTGGSSGANTAYSLSLGSVGGVALTGNATFNVANNGTGLGTTNLGVIGSSGNGITKIGAGRLVLTGANAYTGTTTVNAGTLLLGSANSLKTGTTNAARTAVALTGGNLATGGFSQGSEGASASTLGALTLSGNSSITLGSVAGNEVLSFSDLATNLATFNGILTINNWEGTKGSNTGGDDIFFSSITGANTTSTFTNIQFNIGGVFYGGQFTSVTGGFELFASTTPVPEPSTYIGGGLILALAGWSQRKRLSAFLPA